MSNQPNNNSQDRWSLSLVAESGVYREWRVRLYVVSSFHGLVGCTPGGRGGWRISRGLHSPPSSYPHHVLRLPLTFIYIYIYIYIYITPGDLFPLLFLSSSTFASLLSVVLVQLHDTTTIRYEWSASFLLVLRVACCCRVGQRERVYTRVCACVCVRERERERERERARA